MKEIILTAGWLLASIFGYLNYRQRREIDALRQRLSDTEAARRYDHQAYRQILKDFAALVSEAGQHKKVIDRVDALFDRAFAEADNMEPPYQQP